MGVFVRRVLPALLLALAAGIGARAAVPDLQASLRDKIFATLNPEQQKGLPRTSPIDQMIGKMDLQQRQRAAGRLPALESQFPDPKSLSEIGSVYLKLGSYSEAARVAETLKAKYPEDSRGPFLEAKAKAESGDKEGAIAAAKQAVAVDPGNGEALAFFKLLRSGETQSSQVPLPQTRVAAPATKGPGRNPTMDERYLRRVNGALAMLRRSTHGKRILVAIVPDSDGTVTEADLREHGVRMDVKDEALQGRNFGTVTKSKDSEGNPIFIVSINKAVLDERNDTREVTAYVGGKLDEVDVRKRATEEPPPILFEWRERVAQAYILIELGVEAFATAENSLFSQNVRASERVLQGNLKQKPLAANENYGDLFSRNFVTLQNSEGTFINNGIDLLFLYTASTYGMSPMQVSQGIPDFANKKQPFSESLRRDFPSP